MRYIKYLKYVIRHKWFVFVDGHHRWLAAKKIGGSDKKINVVVIELPISSALKAYSSFSKG